MNDEQIIGLLFRRLEAGLQALADRFGPRLLRTALNILGSRLDAEETVNDTYLALWDIIPPNRPAPLAGFVYRVGRNTALKRLRTNTAQKRADDYSLSLDELAGAISGGTLEEAFDARVLGAAIDRFLSALPRTDRVLFLRRYWFGDRVKDLARELGMTENALSVRLSRLRSRLRDYLNQEGFYEAG